MKNVIKNERGVTLISLAVAIIILGIITTMLIYNVKDTKDIERVSNMYIDIEAIEDRVSNYYTRYGALPIRKDIDISADSTISEWKSEQQSENNEGPLGANDTGNFYVIDLNALENLSLNYGSGYARISGTTMPEDKDIYVINENSHNIFYLHGVKVSDNGVNKFYYSNKEKDLEKVDVRYVAGIKILDGFSYLNGNTKNDLIIKNSSDVEYKWANTVENQYIMTKTGDNYYLASETSPEDKQQIVLGEGQTVEDLIASAKEFGGFYFTPTDLSTNLTVNYFSVAEEDNWGMPYDVTATYTDKNGDKAYIPAGFRISKLSSLNTINKGLVIKKAVEQSAIEAGDTGDEYVWIDVPDNVLENARTLEEIENALKEYTKDYREEGYEDTYEGDFIVMTNDPNKNNMVVYNELKNKMLQSIKENGGFYIGRYEASKSSDNKAQSQKDKKPWNSITVANAQNAANALTTDNYTTSLMFGLQWDLVCKFIEQSEEKTYDEIKKNSTSWGNYKNSKIEFNDESGQMFIYGGDGNWHDVNGSDKSNGDIILYTTGIIKRNMVLNTFDLAGNEMEFTLQRTQNHCVLRGGGYQHTGNVNTMSFHNTLKINKKFSDCGFRVTLFQTPAQTQQ